MANLSDDDLEHVKSWAEAVDKSKGYDEKELFDILNSFIIEEGWILDNNAITIKDIKDNIKLFKYYGGDMRKLFQLAKENYCVRTMKTVLTLDNINKILIRDDLQKGINHFKEHIKEESVSHNMMYI